MPLILTMRVYSVYRTNNEQADQQWSFLYSYSYPQYYKSFTAVNSLRHKITTVLYVLYVLYVLPRVIYVKQSFKDKVFFTGFIAIWGSWFLGSWSIQVRIRPFYAF